MKGQGKETWSAKCPICGNITRIEITSGFDVAGCEHFRYRSNRDRFSFPFEEEKIFLFFQCFVEAKKEEE